MSRLAKDDGESRAGDDRRRTRRPVSRPTAGRAEMLHRTTGMGLIVRRGTGFHRLR